jgi:general secretion pathway protein D
MFLSTLKKSTSSAILTVLLLSTAPLSAQMRERLEPPAPERQRELPENIASNSANFTGSVSLNTQKIAVLNVKGMPMSEFARLVSQGAGWRIAVSRKAAAMPVNIYLEHIGGEDAIKAVCQTLNLWYRIDKNSGLISILTLDEYQRGMLSFAQDTVQVVTVLYPDAKTVGDSLQRLFRNRVVWNPPDDYLNDPIYDVERAVDRMDFMADRVQAILPDTQATSGRSTNRSSRSSSSTSSRNRFSSSEYSNNQRQQQQYRNDQKLFQNEIDEEKLKVQLAAEDSVPYEYETDVVTNREIPGEPGIVYISAFQGTNDLLLRSSDADAVKEVAEVIKKLDKPKPQVLLEVKVLKLDLNDNAGFGLDWMFKSGKWSGGRSTGNVDGTAFGSDYASILSPQGLAPAAGMMLDPKAFVLQYVSNDIAARIQAMQESGRLVALATPNLCVADGEASRIFIGKTTTVLTSVDIQSYTFGDDRPVVNTVTTPETQRLNVGTTLLITPRIHADKTTTIRLVQEESQVGSKNDINYGTGTFQSQDIDMRTVSTTVIAADGKLSAIGGLISEQIHHKDSGIPGLMNIPYIGNAFKTTSDIKSRSELLVLIRPYILLAPDETDCTTHQFMKRLSEHPSATSNTPPLRIGQGTFTIVNEKMYSVPHDAMNAVKAQARPMSTEERE